MKLLFDENLSPRLVILLADLFPGSAHVNEVGLERAQDITVWAYAKDNSFTIVTKDADFGELSILLDAPPKVILIRGDNCSTGQIDFVMRMAYENIN